MIQSIIYSRLVTGHSHDDVDQRFGQIRKATEKELFDTPEDYSKFVEDLFDGYKRKLIIKFKDVMIIPDYKSHFEQHINSQLSLLHKLEHTQHQWKFEAVSVSEMFPYGVKATYKAYSNDMVVEIIKLPKEQCVSQQGRLTGLEPQTVYCKWEPGVDNDIPGRQGVEGIYLLISLPDADILPEAFTFGAQEAINKTISAVRNQWLITEARRAWWEDWVSNIFPKIDGLDGAYMYIDDGHIFDIPLRQFFVNCAGRVCNPHWTAHLQARPVNNPDFRWPDRVAVAIASVRTTFNRHPPPPRLLLGAPVTSLNFEAYKESSVNYYNDTIKVKTKPALELILK